MDIHSKLFISMRYFLIGRQMHTALRALEYASEFHTGTRKDKVTPEYHHQLSIAHYLRTMENHIDYVESTFAAAFLHDTVEDSGVAPEEVERHFGTVVRDAVLLLTKEFRGVKKSPQEYFGAIADCPIASLVKGADRINNIQSMGGVFLPVKQRQYIDETTAYILPMLKVARRKFTTQEGAYMNIKMMLQSQIQLIEASLNAHKETSGSLV